MSEWISVEDRLPEIPKGFNESEDVLAFCVSNGEPTEFGYPNMFEKDKTYQCIDRIVKWIDKEDVSFRTDKWYGKVTHWMPLPKPPM